MKALSDLAALFRHNVAEWRVLRLADLQFGHRSEARLMLIALLALAVVLLVARLLVRRRSGARGVVLPALLASMPRARGSSLVHAPLLLFLLGLPFFVVALADPFTALVSRETTFPGRRIGLMIDASMSMLVPFTAANLNKRAATDARFFTTVAAAERFVQIRKNGKYRDLIGLIEFGHQAYVIMPFTSDYDNVLLSLSLIGDPVEYNAFPDGGTVITRAVDETVGLYKTFDFLEAAGNLMVIFSDGEDSNYQIGAKTLDDVLQSAIEARIPLYLVRINYEREKGSIVPDERWIAAVEKTGGKFYAARDEASVISAIQDIDRVATGRIQMKQYSKQQPRFAIFALIAAGFWTAAAALKLGVPFFQKMA